MECNAEVRVFDPLSPWECYIFALNPADDDEIACIIRGFGVEVTTWSLNKMELLFNIQGEAPQIDSEYRPRQAREVYKQLTRRY